MSIPDHDLNLVVLADLHYVNKARHLCPIPERQTRLGLELACRALERLRRQTPLDAIVLLGDLVDNGSAPAADQDLILIRNALAEYKLPMIVVPGNHDGTASQLQTIFHDWTGIHAIGGYQLVTFADPYGPGDVAVRRVGDLRLVFEAAQRGPVLAFQHNPLWPPIDSTYPYVLRNADEVIRAYADAGVLLSVSGHYHPGQPVGRHGEVSYVTCAALCEAPFRFLHVRVHGRQVMVREERLAMPEGPALVDMHCHTQYAYCATTVEVGAAVERARLFGLAGLVFTEHAGQLYVSAEDFWSARFLTDRQMLFRYRQARRDRMEAYRRYMAGRRSDFVRLGLEVEVDSQGCLTLLPEDRPGWDLLVGAVHWMPDVNPGSASQKELVQRYLWYNHRLVESGIHVLAHPLRWFRRAGLPCPVEVHRPLVDLLAAAGVAAEINFHTNEPDPRFFALCVERGVRIALGSDAHRLEEVGELAPHLALLQQAAGRSDVEDLLFRLEAKDQPGH